jgi:hypothetical protein
MRRDRTPRAHIGEASCLPRRTAAVKILDRWVGASREQQLDCRQVAREDRKV